MKMTSENIIIREFIESDIEFVVNANNIVNDKSGLERVIDTKLSERLKSDFFPINKTKSTAQITIAELDGVSVGMIAFSFCYYMKEGDCLWVTNMFVSPEYQKMGIGTKLIDHVKDIASKNNCEIVGMLEDVNNTPAQQLVEKTGAKRIDNLRYFYIKMA